MGKLPKFTHENGIDYVLVGNYYLPMIRLSEEKRPIGRWGQMHRNYLKERHPALYSSLLLSGKLSTYLVNLDEQAESRLEIIISQMKVAEGVTEELKATDQLRWIQMMSSICNRAEEIIKYEMIYV
ncbi:MAG: TnpV protein [Eubacteriales bacterium]|nr:TnpV protein [Eubacteriales bacterium]